MAIDFSDTLFILDCGCILDGCSGAGGLDRFVHHDRITAMYCPQHKIWGLLKQVVTVGEVRDWEAEARGFRDP